MQNQNSHQSALFGTDGIRGVYGEALTDSLAMLVGNSLGLNNGKIVIGRDNRMSGESLSRALTEGALSAGANVVDLGITTTPCVAYVTRELNASAGVMISASHNPPQYNGIKVFGGDARKLDKARERGIEMHVRESKLAYADTRGQYTLSPDLCADYAAAVVSGAQLDGLKIVLDCSNGAASAIAPDIFSAAGAEVISICTSADGALINAGCGALHPQLLERKVVETGADIGLSFDGDADRVIAVSDSGSIIDGDKIVYILARAMHAAGALPFSAAVGTVHTNMGVELGLKALGISLIRTDIGDHNVIRCMTESGLTLGGEQSGHIIISDFLPTGDGVYAGARLARIVKESGRALSTLDDCTLLPQRNADVVTSHKDEIALSSALRDYVRAVESMLGERGRVMIRPSGTENKLRIMTESVDAFLADFAARSLEMFIRTHFTL